MSNKVVKVISVLLAAVGLAVAIVPQYTHCGGMGGRPACANSATAELILGILLVLTGIGLFFVPAKIWRIVLSSVALTLSALVIVFPLAITGTCGMASMVCNTSLKPWTILLGAIGVGLSLILLIVTLVAQLSGETEGGKS